MVYMYSMVDLFTFGFRFRFRYIHTIGIISIDRGLLKALVPVQY